jgi:acyl-coenzyme A thioesterase PaaI-like protein
MDLVSLFNQIPFAKLLGIELTEASDGHAEGRMAFSEDLLSNPAGDVIHGGAT